MNKALLKKTVWALMFAFELTGCNPVKGELEDTTGYTPVKACIEKVTPYRVMKKTMVSVTVTYAGSSLKTDTAIVSLGREPVSLFHEGDTLQFYVHPERPKELRFKKDKLFLPGRASLKPHKRIPLCQPNIR